ncbi:hypothetical protein L1887_58168 [Cichorium endivia]|nr:hypothetical protein L1887_58168 [Cichorium endivia]
MRQECGRRVGVAVRDAQAAGYWKRRWRTDSASQADSTASSRLCPTERVCGARIKAPSPPALQKVRGPDLLSSATANHPTLTIGDWRLEGRDSETPLAPPVGAAFLPRIRSTPDARIQGGGEKRSQAWEGHSSLSQRLQPVRNLRRRRAPVSFSLLHGGRQQDARSPTTQRATARSGCLNQAPCRPTQPRASAGAKPRSRRACFGRCWAQIATRGCTGPENESRRRSGTATRVVGEGVTRRRKEITEARRLLVALPLADPCHPCHPCEAVRSRLPHRFPSVHAATGRSVSHADETPTSDEQAHGEMICNCRVCLRDRAAFGVDTQPGANVYRVGMTVGEGFDRSVGLCIAENFLRRTSRLPARARRTFAQLPRQNSNGDCDPSTANAM